MRIVPNSTITLYSGIEIDGNDREQLLFQSKANQSAYFASHKVLEKVNCQTVKKRGWIRITAPGSTVSQCNYLSFINPSFDNKVIYCKILNYDYVNNECVDIRYAIDAFQTWGFDASYHNMHIEREHLSEADFQKAELNPYDPTIFEFRTNEGLPISQDTEKRVYNITSTYDDQTQYDGIMCAEFLCDKYDITNSLGVLITFADIDFESLDGGEQVAPFPSELFIQLLHDIKDANDGSFYSLTDATYSHLSTVDGTLFQKAKGGYWSQIADLGPLEPTDASTLSVPINYIYIYGGGESSGNPLVSEFLRLMTKFSTKESVLGLYAIPFGLMVFASRTNSYQLIYAGIDAAGSQNVRNKKLDLYPFSYFRVISPNGDVKELRMEEFQDIQNGDTTGKIVIVLDVTGNPTLIIAPWNYKMNKTGTHYSNRNTNVKEALVFEQFPTLPYEYNGYESLIAAVTNSYIGKRTGEYILDFQNKAIDVGAMSDFDGVLDLPSHFPAVDKTYSKMRTQATAFRLEQGQVETALDELSGIENSYNVNPEIYKTIRMNYNLTRPAYAQNEYNQSNGVGFINYNLASYLDIILMKVTLNPQVLAEYDKYFDLYGYSSGRCGVARVINYMRGSSDTASLPHWTSNGNRETTYIKTAALTVDGVMQPVSDAIENMFNNGVRFIKGD